MIRRYPRISVVTPSYNQSAFLDEAIRSVLNQGYPDLEYVVIDGGSSDRSVEVIRAYTDRLAYWVSEPDKGQYDAVNRGFARTTGEIMAWLNSDDKFAPWAFSVVGEIFSTFPEVDWITSAYPLLWNERGQPVGCQYGGGFSKELFYRGVNLIGGGRARPWIQQESTFWRKSLWERAGGYVDASLRFAGDCELWARFFQHAELYSVTSPLGGFRAHDSQKTATHMAEYLREAQYVFGQYGRTPPGKLEGLVRRWMWAALGHRSLRKLPRPVVSLLCRLHLLSPFKVCAWSGNQWSILVDYSA